MFIILILRNAYEEPMPNHARVHYSVDTRL